MRSLMTNTALRGIAAIFGGSVAVESWTRSDATMDSPTPPFGSRNGTKSSQRKAVKAKARKRAKRLRHF